MKIKVINTKAVIRKLFFATAFAVALVGCSGGSGGGSGGANTGSGATLMTITVSPANSSVKVGGTTQLTATGLYSDGSSANISGSVIWGSSVAGIATVSTTGTVTGVAAGAAVISAASGSVTGSSSIAVTAWTTRLSAPRSTGPLGGIAWDGTKYVAAGGSISVSNDLLVWDEQVSMASSSDVVWNGSLFVAGGFFGIKTSSDGLKWTTQMSTGSNSPLSFAYSSTLPLWVGVGNNGYVYTSRDGVAWATLNPTTNFLMSVVWTGTQFVAVGDMGTILTSPDGVSWTVRTSGTTNMFTAVGATPSLLVAASTGGFYTSPDGITWTPSASSIPNGYSIINAGGQWVAVGFNFAASSPDGVNWTTSPSTVGQLHSVIHDGTQYVAAGSTVASIPAIYTSPDGLIWELKTSYEKYISIARNPSSGLLVAVSSTDRSLASTDNGATWQHGGYSSPGTGGWFNSVVWYPALSQFIAAGGTGVFSSIDGLTWTGVGNTSCWGKISASPTLLVNACQGFTTGGISTSPDGVTWTARTTPSTRRANNVIWTGTQFIALSSGGEIVTSPDGISWTIQASGTTSSLNGYAASSTLMVIVGSNGTIITSSDGGTTWASQTSGTSFALNRVVWTGTQFVAIGGAGKIFSSTDGVTWTAQYTPYTNLFGSDLFNLNDIILTGTSVVLVGDRGLVATSP